MTKQQDQDLLVRGIDPDANPNQNVIDPEHYFGQYSTVYICCEQFFGSVTFFYRSGPLSNGSGCGSWRPKNIWIRMRN
jgi:hypothetical protein